MHTTVYRRRTAEEADVGPHRTVPAEAVGPAGRGGGLPGVLLPGDAGPRAVRAGGNFRIFDLKIKKKNLRSVLDGPYLIRLIRDVERSFNH